MVKQTKRGVDLPQQVSNTTDHKLFVVVIDKPSQLIENSEDQKNVVCFYITPKSFENFYSQNSPLIIVCSFYNIDKFHQKLSIGINVTYKFKQTDNKHNLKVDIKQVDIENIIYKVGRYEKKQEQAKMIIQQLLRKDGFQELEDDPRFQKYLEQNRKENERIEEEILQQKMLERKGKKVQKVNPEQSSLKQQQIAITIKEKEIETQIEDQDESQEKKKDNINIWFDYDKYSFPIKQKYLFCLFKKKLFQKLNTKLIPNKIEYLNEDQRNLELQKGFVKQFFKYPKNLDDMEDQREKQIILQKQQQVQQKTRKMIFDTIYHKFIRPYRRLDVKHKATFENLIIQKNKQVYDSIEILNLEFNDHWYGLSDNHNTFDTYFEDLKFTKKLMHGDLENKTKNNDELNDNSKSQQSPKVKYVNKYVVKVINSIDYTPKPFKCDYCKKSKAFKDDAFETNPYKYKESGENKEIDPPNGVYFQCDICNVKYKEATDKVYICRHPYIEQVVCQKCQQYYDNRQILIYQYKKSVDTHDTFVKFLFDSEKKKFFRFIDKTMIPYPITTIRYGDTFHDIYDQHNKYCGIIPKEQVEQSLQKIQELAYLANIPLIGVKQYYKFAMLDKVIEQKARYQFRFKIQNIGYNNKIVIGICDKKQICSSEYNYQVKEDSMNEINGYFIFSDGGIFSSRKDNFVQNKKGFTFGRGDKIEIEVNSLMHYIKYTKERTEVIIQNDFYRTQKNKITGESQKIDYVPFVALTSYDDQVQFLEGKQIEKELMKKNAQFCEKIPPYLKQLTLNYNNCRQIDYQNFTDLKYPVTLNSLSLSFRSCKGFTSLDKSNLLINLPSSIDHLSVDFSSCPHTTNKSLKSVANSIKHLKKITWLHLDFSWSSEITDDGIKQISDKLPDSLETLDLYFMECSELTIWCIKEPILQAINEKLINLKNLYMNFHWCKQINEQEYLETIIQMMGNKKQEISNKLGFQQYNLEMLRERAAQKY